MKTKVINILFNDFTNDNRVLKESRSLIKDGFKVELVCTRFEKKNPKEENREGIMIRRVYVGSIVFLPINLFFFWLNVIKLYKNESIFHCNDLYALPPAYFIKKFFNSKVKIVYDCHEHETEALIYLGRPLLKWFAKIFERKMIKSANKVITVSDSIAEEYRDLYNIEKPSLVMNCPSFMSPHRLNLFREKFNIGNDKIIFLFHGEYLKGRGIENLIEIFRELERLNNKLVLILLIYGKDLEELKKRIDGSNNIFWHDKVSVDVYMDYVSSVDWGISLMENLCKNYNYSLPNKLFDYIMAGLPVIVSDLKEMKKFVEENNVGYVVDSTDSDKVIELLKNISKEDAKEFNKNLEIVAKKYSWEEQEKVLINIYNSL